MLTLLAIAGGLILGAGLAVLRQAIRHAPEGHEDPLGFHYDGPVPPPEPRPASAPALAAPHAVPHDCLAP